MSKKVIVSEAMLIDAIRDHFSKKREEWIVLSQVRSSTGHVRAQRYADAIAINTWASSGCPLHGFEVKVSRPDLVKELTHPEKSAEIKQFCNHWWLVLPSQIILQDGELPEDWGLMTLHGSKLVIRKAAPPLNSSPVDGPFLASMLRSAYRQAPNRDEINIAERRGYQKGKQEAVSKTTLQNGKEQVRKLSRLRDKIDLAIGEYHRFLDHDEDE